VAVYVLSFFYGAAIGSFVQVVATRLNVAPVAASKSKCLSCGEALRASDLVPVFSYLFLKGKCRYCKVPYGMSALCIEIMFGVVFVLLYHFFLIGVTPWTALAWLLYYTLLFISLGVVTLYDYKHSYVPVPYLFVFSLLCLLMLGMRYVYEPSAAVLLGPVVVSLPFLLIWIFSRGKALGFGDVILYMAVGAFFGIEQGLAVLLISIWLGAIVGIVIYTIRRKNKNTNSAIPFVPFIVLAFLIVLFTDMSIFSFAGLFA
jgi:prepilin signal peptidase PulO-like enzyme (type II secretory pathway)